MGINIKKWFSFKQNDRKPALAIEIQYLDTDIKNAGYPVKFYMRKYSDTTRSGELKVSGNASVVSAIEEPAGSGKWLTKIKYMWADGDLDTAGDYIAEFSIEYPDGTLTVPSDGYIGIRVYPDVD